MAKIVFASFNDNKVNEIAKAAKAFGIEVVSPKHIEITNTSLNPFVAVKETEDSYIGNARLKATACVDWCGLSSFADDSGLEIEGIDNRPGVFTANYAEGKTQAEKNQLLISELGDNKNRKAKFVSLQCFIRPDGTEIITEGELIGSIAHAPKGKNGWGYEPIFIPDGYDRTIAELKDQGIFIKNHRALALERLFKALLAKRFV